MTTPARSTTPWKDIWFQPRRTIQDIIDTDPRYDVLPLAALVGISNALDRASLKNAGDTLDLAVIIGICVVGGAVSGLITLFLFGWLLEASGRWLGGRGSQLNLRAAMAWGSLPVICTLPLWIPQIVLYGKEIFSQEAPRIGGDPVPFTILLLVELVLAVWGVVLVLKCIGQVQGFSAWRALGNLLLATLLIVVPLLLLLVLLTVL